MSDEEEKIRQKLTPLFDGMMRALYSQKGAQFSVDILASDEAQSFIDAHAAALDSGFAQVEMSDAMRSRLQRSDWIFSGMKTFHEMNEAFPSLLDENGNRKPFEQFLNDVRTIDNTYNGNYLRAEYGFVQASAEMAAKWEEFAEDGDRYNLQYRTAGDDKVRPEHAALNGVTLPMSDPFWADYYPPNGWGCRCTVVQVRKSKYPATDSDEAQALGEVALQTDKKGIFRFNSGQKEQTMPDYNPYTIRRCNDCDKTKLKLAGFTPDYQICQACELVRECVDNKEKSKSAIQRKHYIGKEMAPLLNVKVNKTTGSGERLKVKFRVDGNKHLYSDIVSGMCKGMKLDDLKDMDILLESSTYLAEKAAEGKEEKEIEYFYYYKARLRNKWVNINVAKRVKHRKSGKTFVEYFVYSVRDIKNSTRGDG